MRFDVTAIEGVVLIGLEPHVDSRGAFARTFCEREFTDAGLPASFPQCNLSVNDRAGTLRGLHFNIDPYGESKLVRCVRGAIFDVVVDLRENSSTRFEHIAVELSADNRLALFIPAGFAHGFVTLTNATDVYYHMGSSFVPEAARGLRWNDERLRIDWPVVPTTMSATDASYPDLNMDTFDLADHSR